MVQEALTNAHKHGGGTATVSLRFDDEGLKVAVVNPVSAAAGGTDALRDGYGLVGMRERVEAVGGTLSAGSSR